MSGPEEGKRIRDFPYKVPERHNKLHQFDKRRTFILNF